MSEARAAVDSITLEVLRGRLETVAEEMELTLLRSSHSTIVNEALDATSAIFDARGRTVAQAIGIPVHLGVLVTVAELVAKSYPDGVAFPGDVYAFNDPYGGGTHLPDIAIFSPVFVGGGLVGYTGTMSHHQDVGGVAPGSLATEARDIIAEGLVIPLVKLVDGGTLNEALRDVMEANTRAPDALRGDIDAQMSACEVGRRRFVEVHEEWGGDVVDAAVDMLMDQAERLTRVEIEKIPDGEYHFTDWLDDDGRSLGAEPRQFSATMRVKGSDVEFDFEGTSPQTEAAINNVPPSTEAIVYYFIRTLSGEEAPGNAGTYRPVTVTLPPGTMVNPLSPAPVAARGLAMRRISDVVLGVMAQAIPERMNAASCGQSTILPVGGVDPATGERFVGMIGGPWMGGMGARLGKDGIDCTDNVFMVPVETTEAELPLRFTSLQLWTDSGGAGTWRGGLGYVAEVEWLRGDATISVRRDRHKFGPWGLEGGLAGPPCRTDVVRADGTVENVPTKEIMQISQGDVLRYWTTGSGGYAPPHQRDVAAVLADVLDGMVSLESAEADYGVVVDGEGVDEAATAALRTEAH